MFTLFLCYFSRGNVFTLFMLLSRANMFMPFCVIFLKRMCLRCLWYFREHMCFCCVYATFTSEYVYYVSCFVFFSMSLRWVICRFFASEYVSAVYGTSLSASEYVYAVMWNSYQRICFALLYPTFASKYGYAGLWNSFSSYYVSAVIWNFLPTHMFTLLRVSTVGVIYISCRCKRRGRGGPCSPVFYLKC